MKQIGRSSPQIRSDEIGDEIPGHRRDEEVNEQRCAKNRHNGFLAFQIQNAVLHIRNCEADCDRFCGRRVIIADQHFRDAGSDKARTNRQEEYVYGKHRVQ